MSDVALRNSLARHGILVEIAEANLITGRIELRITWPDGKQRRGVTALRSSFKSRTVVKSYVVRRVPGMYQDFWEIGEEISDLRFDDAREGFLSAIHRVTDNSVLALEGREAYASLIETVFGGLLPCTSSPTE